MDTGRPFGEDNFDKRPEFRFSSDKFEEDHDELNDGADQFEEEDSNEDISDESARLRIA